MLNPYSSPLGSLDVFGQSTTASVTVAASLNVSYSHIVKGKQHADFSAASLNVSDSHVAKGKQCAEISVPDAL